MLSVDRINGVTGDLAIKTPVRVATTANITLEGLQTIDGVALAADDRVLVWKQTTAANNGIWIANTSAWSRALDFDGRFDVVQGTMVLVVAGTVNAGSVFKLDTVSPVIGTSSLSFSVANYFALRADLASTANGMGAGLSGFSLAATYAAGTVGAKLQDLHAGNFTGGVIELGRIDGTASTPLIDFHSGATAVDYDVRVIASGGTGVAGGGNLAFNLAVASFGSLITLDAVNGFVNGERLTARKDTNTTWPAIVIDNFSTGAAAEVAINFRKKNASDVQLGHNITLGFGDYPNGGELNFEPTDSTGAVRASPLTITQDGRVRIGGFVALASYGTNVQNLIAADGTAQKVLVVRGYPGQTADLQTWQNDSQQGLAFLTKDGYFAVGGINQASVGAIRLPNNGSIVSRNAANTADVNLISGNAADQVALGTGNDIRWGTALVALGGGAAPTLGTIGGAGPAVAAQNTWMRAIDSAGAAFWVPAWK